MKNNPENNLKFRCKRCGYCCTRHGQYAYLFVTKKDVDQLAAALNIPAKSFKEKYTRVSGRKRTLIFKKRVCPFYLNNSCTVYYARPVQCSSWPYWKENIRKNRFVPSLKRICPGIKSG
jgi:hypothetical protein